MFSRVPGGWEVPPFLNAHTHSEWNACACLSRGDGYLPWLARVLALAADPARQDAGIAATPGLMRAAGIGSILDHGATGSATGGELFPGRHHVEFLRDLPAVSPPPEAWAPHAVHTVHESALEVLRAFPGPISIHAGEAREERELYETGQGPLADLLLTRGFTAAHVRRLRGRSPAALLDDHGLLGPRTVLVHGIHLPDDDLDRIAKRGAIIALCPLSNRAMGTGFGNDNGQAIRQVERMLDRGIRIALGTDSALSAPTLSILDNARVLAADGLAPARILPMLWSAVGTGLAAPLGPPVFVPETNPDPILSLLHLAR